MTKTNLELEIEKAAAELTEQVVSALRSATLRDLIAMQYGGMHALSSHELHRIAPAIESVLLATSAKKKRVVVNYPKCSFPGCDKNRFVRGKGYCGDHWRQWTAGEIPGPSMAVATEPEPAPDASEAEAREENPTNAAE